MSSFNQILNDIKSVKIQGATNIAKAGLKALKLQSDSTSIKQILSSRPTEPCLQNSIRYAKTTNVDVAYHFLNSLQNRVTSFGEKIIKTNSNIFTHCHSSTVIDILAKSKANNKKFEVSCTETRPLLQGRKTAKDLNRLKIKTTCIVDSAAHDFLKKSDIFLLGADQITKTGNVINKIGSNLFAEIAYNHKIPLYICTNSWKFSEKNLKIEERNPDEVWDQELKYVTVENSAFGKINQKYIKGIISELGILPVKKFLKQVKKTYPWI
jgi:translation initiation factor 2B subunit (eIF-2B alpha/beta/delta family)